MKTLAILSVIFLSMTSFGLDLSDVSNSELLEELEKRLSLGGQGEKILVEYSCFNGYSAGLYLKMYKNGNLKTGRIAGGRSGVPYPKEACEKTVTSLKSTFSGSMYFAVCFGEEGRSRLMKGFADGQQAKHISSQRFTKLADCVEAANTFNSQN